MVIDSAREGQLDLGRGSDAKWSIIMRCFGLYRFDQIRRVSRQPKPGRIGANLGDLVGYDLDRPSVEPEYLVCNLCNLPEGFGSACFIVALFRFLDKVED